MIDKEKLPGILLFSLLSIGIIALVWGLNFGSLNNHAWCDGECYIFEKAPLLTFPQNLIPFRWAYHASQYGFPDSRCTKICDITLQTTCENVCDKYNNCWKENCITNKSIEWESKELYEKYGNERQ